MNKKIKQATQDKVPFLLIAGGQEVESGTVTVRQAGVQEQETVAAKDFVERANALIASRALDRE
jgi:threonyl-tRNA synthetase